MPKKSLAPILNLGLIAALIIVAMSLAYVNNFKPEEEKDDTDNNNVNAWLYCQPICEGNKANQINMYLVDEKWITYKNVDLDLSFKYPESLAIKEPEPALNINVVGKPIIEWPEIIMAVDKLYFSMTREKNYYGRYESNWINTFYSKSIDFSKTNEELYAQLDQDFDDIFDVQKDFLTGQVYEGTKTLHFYEMANYGGYGTLLYRVLITHPTFGNILATYVIDQDFIRWDATSEAAHATAVLDASHYVGQTAGTYNVMEAKKMIILYSKIIATINDIIRAD